MIFERGTQSASGILVTFHVLDSEMSTTHFVAARRSNKNNCTSMYVYIHALIVYICIYTHTFLYCIRKSCIHVLYNLL